MSIAAPATENLISIRALGKSFTTPEGKPIPVLEGIDLDVAEGEFVALLGRSGSGKSTLLRCIAGLIGPSSGEVRYRGNRLLGTNLGTAMVFQTFALLPWLTVQENVEIGLEARGVVPEQRVERALKAIDIVGLDGYESAFPKELSGGMRQRVGFARALVVEPDVLLMDEPFSALDVLTAENLRGELLELWEGRRFPTRSVVMVTHNIEEAVLLADRILVLGTNPGRIRAELRNQVPRPRHRRTPDFDELVDRIYRIMTGRPESAAVAAPAQPQRRDTPAEVPLPRATVDGLSGLAEILQNRNQGAADLADLAEILGLEVDDLLPLVDALVLLGFADLDGDHLRLSPSGGVFAGASIQASKEIFARAVLDRAPLVRTIASALQGARDGNLPTGFFLDLLHRSFGEEDAHQQLDTAINWGRYAELYGFDAARAQLIREDHPHYQDGRESGARPSRGILHVYLGAAPGSGKTFAMLREGQARRARGEDVVIGFAEAHGRPRTLEAIGNLEVVPSRWVGGGEMDLEAVIARRPQVALVDDLAHSTLPGSRNAKRWQDVENLLELGIDVISTVDVQQVESVQDVVESITGVAVSGTLPDTVLASAEVIQFIDIGPEALRRRLRHGNILPREEVEEGLAGFFQAAKLGALREIGLRLVAQAIAPVPGGVPPEPQDVMVAISSPAGAERLIRRGGRLARRTGARCSVVAMSPPGRGGWDGDLEFARGIADQVGATFLVREASTRDREQVIREAVRELAVSHLLIADPGRPALTERWRGTLTDRLIEALPDIDVHVLAPIAAISSGSSPAREPAVPARSPDQADGRGALRIYLGYACGCGTTIAMLDEARRRRSRGTDVVVAAVSTHDRPETESALGDLELLGRPGGGLDVDWLLARNPQVACIDDLAELDGGLLRANALNVILGAGITVIATLHVADISSMPEALGQRLPGRGQIDPSVLALAEEVELVDVAPPVLIDRVRRGEVVQASDVEDAIEVEFTPERLAALREQAFRTVADRADRQLFANMGEDRSQSPWETRPRVLACVPPRPGMEGLLRRAAALAGAVDGEFKAATVQTGRESASERQLLEGYDLLTKQMGGEFVILEGEVAGALAGYARNQLVTEILVTRGRPRRWHRSTLRKLVQKTAGVDLHVLKVDRGPSDSPH